MPRIVFVCCIVLAHVGLVALLERDGIALHLLKPVAEPMIAEILLPDVQTVHTDELAISSVDELIEIPLPALPNDIISEPQRDAPQIETANRPDIATFSARAQLPPGRVATVILLLEIAPDGSVMSAQVVRSNADAAANAAAIDYARSTRWTPGMIDGHPSAMQASLTVILGENS